jgi:hypothetical protein
MPLEPPTLSNLPLEISTHIVALSIDGELAHNAFQTFHALIHVSRRIRIVGYAGCLPYIPVVLHNQKDVKSFSALLRSHPEFGPKVQNLFLATKKSSPDDRTILRACYRVTSLACYLQPLQFLIERISPFSHECLRHLTLMNSNVPWERLLAHQNGQQLFRQLTHFRSAGVGEYFALPNTSIPGSCFSSLTHLSFNCQYFHTPCLARHFCDSERFPALQHIVPTIPFTSLTAYLTYKLEGYSTHPGVTAFPCPEEWDEADVWRDARTGGLDVWEIATLPDDPDSESSSPEYFEDDVYFPDYWGSLSDEQWADALGLVDEDDTFWGNPFWNEGNDDYDYDDYDYADDFYFSDDLEWNPDS